MIKTSIINNDSSNLDWALDQKDVKTIENTVNLMDKEILQLFICKLVEKFQSANIMKRNFVIWIDCLFRSHFYTILTLPKEIQEKLITMQVLINSRTKNFVKLIEVKSKLESILSLFSNKQGEKPIQNVDNAEDTPMLLYNESDSDEEKNKQFNLKLKKNKIKESAIENVALNKKKKCNQINDKVEKEIDDEILNIDDEDVNIEMAEEIEDPVDEDELDEYDDIMNEELDDNDL